MCRGNQISEQFVNAFHMNSYSLLILLLLHGWFVPSIVFFWSCDHTATASVASSCIGGGLVFKTCCLAVQ